LGNVKSIKIQKDGRSSWFLQGIVIKDDKGGHYDFL
jgi:hypothetical protein